MIFEWGHSKSMSPDYHQFLIPPPPCHTLSPYALNPSPLVTTQILKNFEVIMSRPFMQILDLIFAKICIFSTSILLQFCYLHGKLHWRVDTVVFLELFEFILMQLLTRYLLKWWHHSLAWPPPPLVTLCHYFAWPPSPPRPVTYFLNGP